MKFTNNKKPKKTKSKQINDKQILKITNQNTVFIKNLKKLPSDTKVKIIYKKNKLCFDLEKEDIHTNLNKNSFRGIFYATGHCRKTEITVGELIDYCQNRKVIFDLEIGFDSCVRRILPMYFNNELIFIFSSSIDEQLKKQDGHILGLEDGKSYSFLYNLYCYIQEQNSDFQDEIH